MKAGVLVVLVTGCYLSHPQGRDGVVILDGGENAGDSRAADARGACPSYTSLSAGTVHVCAADESANVVCWGDNEWGQLGVGEGAPRQGVVSPGVDDVAQIVSGDRHTCARKNDGSVWCWGFNASGQIGDGTSGDGWRGVRYTPVRVLGLEDAVHLTSAASYVLARRNSGEDVWWGKDIRSGQYWDDTLPGRAQARAVPLTEFARAERIIAGDNRMCGIYNDGTVSCFGSNRDGVLGRETVEQGDAQPAPMELAGAIADVALGWTHTCVLRSGRVTCFGRNDVGQLGDPESGNPVTPLIVRGRDDVESIVAGGVHTCALHGTGEVSCWGEGFPPMGQVLVDDGVQIEAATFSVLIRRRTGDLVIVGRGQTPCLAP